jgi:hypothetical protein
MYSSPRGWAGTRMLLAFAAAALFLLSFAGLWRGEGLEWWSFGFAWLLLLPLRLQPLRAASSSRGVGGR